MPCTYILTLIDAQIDLLQQARRLLTAPEPPVSQPRQTKNKRLRAADPKTREAAQLIEQGSAASLPTLTVPVPTPSAPGMASPKRAQRRSRLRPVKPPIAVLTALSGPVSAGPIFVPAGQVRNLEVQREEFRSAAQNLLSSESTATLTAQVLARSWMIDSRL